MRTNHLFATIVLAGWTVSTVSAAANETSCVSDWSEASAIVTREGLGDWRQIAVEQGFALGGIVRTELCRLGERFVYRIVVRERDGRFRRFEVDARLVRETADGRK